MQDDHLHQNKLTIIKKQSLKIKNASINCFEFEGNPNFYTSDTNNFPLTVFPLYLLNDEKATCSCLQVNC